MKTKVVKQAVSDSFNSTYGYFYYDGATHKVFFQPTQGTYDEPDVETWPSNNKYLGRPYEFGNADEREMDLYLLLEAKGCD